MPLLRAGEIAKVIGKAQVTHALVEDALVAEVEAAREMEPVLGSRAAALRGRGPATRRSRPS